MTPEPSAPTPTRQPAVAIALVLVGLGLGLAIAAVDSSPGWDDSGITAGVVVLAAAGLAAIDGRRPWLWAALIGAPTAIVEIVTTGNTGSLLAIAFAAVGASIGWAVGREVRRPGPSAG